MSYGVMGYITYALEFLGSPDDGMGWGGIVVSYPGSWACS